MLIREGFQNACFSYEGMVLGRGYPEIVVINQIDKVAFGRDQSV